MPVIQNLKLLTPQADAETIGSVDGGPVLRGRDRVAGHGVTLPGHRHLLKKHQSVYAFCNLILTG